MRGWLSRGLTFDHGRVGSVFELGEGCVTLLHQCAVGALDVLESGNDIVQRPRNDGASRNVAELRKQRKLVSLRIPFPCADMDGSCAPAHDEFRKLSGRVISRLGKRKHGGRFNRLNPLK